MSRLLYIDGLKGFCAVCVVILHYMMAFVGSGYIGWESGINTKDMFQVFWSNLPVSLFINATFLVQLFLAIIAFLPAWHFFNKNDVEWIKKQAIVRYFRFVPYTFFVTMISYFIYINGGYFNQEVGNLLNLPWNNALMQGNFSLSDAFISSLFRVFWQLDGSYVASLWCMFLIFLGSYLAYALLLLFASNKRHMLVYTIILFCCMFTAPWAMSFVGGIMVASIACNELKNPSNEKFKAICGWSLLSVGVGLGLCLDGLTTNGFIADIFKNIAALCVLLSMFYLSFLQKLFSLSFFQYLGKYVFSIIVVHSLVLLSLSSWVFIELHAKFGYNTALWLTLISGIVFNAIPIVVFAKLVDPICAYLSRIAYNVLR